jgi:hypothetical protein
MTRSWILGLVLAAAVNAAALAETDECIDSTQLKIPMGDAVGDQEAEAIRQALGLDASTSITVRMVATAGGYLNLTVVDGDNCLIAADTLTYGEYGSILGVRGILEEAFSRTDETEPAEPEPEPQPPAIRQLYKGGEAPTPQDLPAAVHR